MNDDLDKVNDDFKEVTDDFDDFGDDNYYQGTWSASFRTLCFALQAHKP